MLSCLFLVGCGSAGKADNEKTVAESKIANESNTNENSTEAESESVKKEETIILHTVRIRMYIIISV